MMRLIIKRVLTIITLERWTVRWDKTPSAEAQVQGIVSVTASETVQCLPEDTKRPVEDHPEEAKETWKYAVLNLRRFR